MAGSVQHRQFTARCLTLTAAENGRLLPQGMAGEGHGGREGGRGLEITCGWGSLEPLCKHGWNENKVGFFYFFFFFGDLYGIQAQHCRLSCTLPFRKAAQCRRSGPRVRFSTGFVHGADLLCQLYFCTAAIKGGKKKIVIIGGKNSWHNRSELE